MLFRHFLQRRRVRGYAVLRRWAKFVFHHMVYLRQQNIKYFIVSSDPIPGSSVVIAPGLGYISWIWGGLGSNPTAVTSRTYNLAGYITRNFLFGIHLTPRFRFRHVSIFWARSIVLSLAGTLRCQALRLSKQYLSLQGFSAGLITVISCRFKFGTRSTWGLVIMVDLISIIII
jgi:hypothetical protein